MYFFKTHSRLITFEGFLFLLLGLLAITLPFLSTFITEQFIGWLLTIGGAVQLYRSVKERTGSVFYASLLSSILNILLGGLLIFYPLQGVLSLTFLLIIFFIFQAVSQFILALKTRPLEGWGWLLLNSLLALAMALIIIFGWPSTAFWTIGLLVGINMIFFGISFIVLGMGLSKISKNHE